jgi:curved DNA-binding protein
MAVKFRDYYEVLGVPRTASADEIKRAYRQLARKYHPDLQPASERAKAAERFKEINEANEVLTDPDKRAKYDALGQNWKNGAEYTPPPGTGWSGTTGGDWEEVDGFSDFFSSLFGRQTTGAGRTRRGGAERGGVRVTLPGTDIEAELPVGLDELLRGGRRRVSLAGGRTVDVDIPFGARAGTTLRLAGRGEPGAGGGPPGDLYLRLRLIPHPRYRVVGDDLEMDLPLSPWQAVLGADVQVETPDGPVTVKVRPGTQSGRRLRLRGRGLPRGGDGARGDLHALVRIDVPASPSAAEREAYEAVKRAAGWPAGS